MNRVSSLSIHYYWGDKVGWRLVSRLSRTAGIISRSEVCAKWHLAFSSPNKSIVVQHYFYFLAEHSFFISFALSGATQVNTKSVSKGLVRFTAALSVHM